VAARTAQSPHRHWLCLRTADGRRPARIGLTRYFLFSAVCRHNPGPHVITVASYHAPPGVTYKRLKPQQAVQFAKWLTTLQGPVLLGADANTPRIDHPDFELLRTHWHTGSRGLKGKPGDDLMWGPRKIHKLHDALRLWLQQHPARLKRLRSTCPTGPLAVSLYTGRRNGPPVRLGTPRRFDSVWIDSCFDVRKVEYPYAQSISAGSDHSAVIVDVVLRGSSGARSPL
jgi:hypothetical protein